MADPFYHKTRKKKGSRLLQADAWLDSTLYDFFTGLGRGYQHFQDFMSRFHVTGFKRLFVELVSDGLTFGMLGLLVLTTLALPAFDETASGQFNPAEDYAVTFLDRYGNEVGRRGIRTDDSVALDKLPDYLIKATLATEDRRFYDHFGIDVMGTLRALISNVQANSVVEGGSSITQQLAKNLFLSSERTYERKIKEAFLSLWLETHYTKDEILKMYLDRSYMGGGNYGVAAAAEFYFSKSVRDISLAEAAMLAGMFKAPGHYAPHIDLARARSRANDVLTNLVQAGFMTEGQVTGARRKPAAPVDRSDEIDAPNYFLDWAFEEVKSIVAERSDGISFVVRTTIDPVLQDYAEEAVSTVIREEGDAFDVSQAAMVVLGTDGAVRAMVGGLDYGKSQFNRATTPNRQPGSSFKPFVYATALESGRFSPSSVVRDQPVCISGWCPQNYGRSYAGNVTLKTALTRSINTVPVTLSISTGRGPIADMAHRMGIRNEFPVTRSLPLGVISVSVLDMASTYAVFANRGHKTPAFGITRINSTRGDLVYEAPDATRNELILSEETVTGMNDMLRNVVTSGTGRRAIVEGVPAAGKTGTTQSYRDAWFCGYTGNYVAAVWFGNDDYTPTRRLTGGRLPAQTWQKFMEYAHTNIEVQPLQGVDFDPLPRVVEASNEGSEGGERPPTLSPEAADKLLALSGVFRAALTDLTGEGPPLEAAEGPAPSPAEPSLTPANFTPSASE
ncbi:transglycosylase domain-containing protein [Cucumibacter marinus]|uniref:transglycosylase domain-containing protein n=1 Tax=Cucumibacter marinus TaxID=1121252 RepID=UPI00041CE6E7|nr:PBP1A family penicillin-binding protein [Cucumibacter marinus]